jgi:cell division protein FtsB
MNPFEFVLAVLILVFAFTIIRHKMGIPVRSMREMRGDPPVNDVENDRLRQQVQQLQERIRVLERIVTDRGVETAAQIEALRDRDALEDGDKVR